MESFIGHALSVFMGFFAIMNPIANTPVFLGLTSDDSPEVRRAVARKAMTLSFVIMGLILAVIGTQMVIAGIDGAIRLAQAG